MSDRPRLIIVSGLSGSGKTVALHTLEDSGCYCIDNLPVTLLTAFGEHVNSLEPGAVDHYAVGVDARNRTSELQAFDSIVTTLKTTGMATSCTPCTEARSMLWPCRR